MKLRIEIDLSNDAFENEEEEMLKNLLVKLSETIPVMSRSMSIMDTNGNTVGFARYCEY